MMALALTMAVTLPQIAGADQPQSSTTSTTTSTTTTPQQGMTGGLQNMMTGAALSAVQGACQTVKGTWKTSESGNWHLCCWQNWGCFACSKEGKCKMKCQNDICKKATSALSTSSDGTLDPSQLQNVAPPMKGTTAPTQTGTTPGQPAAGTTTQQ